MTPNTVKTVRRTPGLIVAAKGGFWLAQLGEVWRTSLPSSSPRARYLAASLAAAVATCLPWALAMASSLADGCRSPCGPAIVVAP